MDLLKTKEELQAKLEAAKKYRDQIQQEWVKVLSACEQLSAQLSLIDELIRQSKEDAKE